MLILILKKIMMKKPLNQMIKAKNNRKASTWKWVDVYSMYRVYLL